MDDLNLNIDDFLMADDTELEFDLKDFDLLDKKENTPDEQKKEFIAKDNIQHDDWDWGKLKNDWNTEKLADWGLEESKDLSNTQSAIPTRYIKPKFSTTPIVVDYKNAVDLVQKIKLFPGEQIHSIVDGNFVFGDLIEALLRTKNVICKNMHIATLSMSENNVDSLAALLDDGYIENLTVIVSNYFYSHEKNGIIKMLLERCDKANRFDLIVIRNHTKITLMEISNLKLVLTGSSNLRSSRSLEQFLLQENPELYQFYLDFFKSGSWHSIINKTVPK